MTHSNKEPIKVIELSQEVINLYVKYGTIKVIDGKYISIEGNEIVAENDLKPVSLST